MNEAMESSEVRVGGGVPRRRPNETATTHGWWGEMIRSFLQIVLWSAVLAGPVGANDWPNWRGPEQTGASREKAVVTSWSPDGSRIAFSSNRDGNFDIYTMSADGSGLTRLTNHPASDKDPVWSP